MLIASWTIALLGLAVACNAQQLPVVQVVQSSGQCMPQTITLREGITYRISFLNQDAGGSSWDFYLNVPSRERPDRSDAEPSLMLTARAQQSAAGVVTPRKTGQFEYTCVTETRSFTVRPGVVNVVE